MRVLFTATPGHGHVLPMLPLAAATAKGHAVAFATSSEHRERIAALGIEPIAVGPTDAEVIRRFAARQPEIRALAIPVRRESVFRWRFAELVAPERLPGLRAAVERWQPDVVVHESADLAGALVAAERELTVIHHAVGQAVPARPLAGAAAALAATWAAAGLEIDQYAGVYRGHYLDVCPPSLQRVGVPDGVPVQPLRPVEAGTSGAARDLIYVTLGTTHNKAATFRVLLDALIDPPDTVLVTVGRTLDPATLGAVPAGVRIEQFVPQGDVLGRARLVVSHGGAGSLFGALAHSCPLLLVPQGADQFDNADAATGAGAALTLLPHELTPEAVRERIDQILAEPVFARAADRIAAEIAMMPSPDDVATRLFG